MGREIEFLQGIGRVVAFLKRAPISLGKDCTNTYVCRPRRATYAKMLIRKLPNAKLLNDIMS
jgi:hypothetical protein